MHDYPDLSRLLMRMALENEKTAAQPPHAHMPTSGVPLDVDVKTPGEGPAPGAAAGAGSAAPQAHAGGAGAGEVPPASVVSMQSTSQRIARAKFITADLEQRLTPFLGRLNKRKKLELRMSFSQHRRPSAGGPVAGVGPEPSAPPRERDHHHHHKHDNVPAGASVRVLCGWVDGWCVALWVGAVGGG